jgi:bidirectional [NiFe] hydrogenase diaphorase subunit
MQAMSVAIAPPSEDKRWRIIQTTMRRHGYSPHALIETLHSVQAAFGYLDEASLCYVAQSLHVPLSRVYGVATFYNLFTLKPQGAHSCVVCMGTACYIKGGQQILAALEQTMGVRRGETTPDKQVSLMVARCLGTCGLAPAVVLDEEVQGQAMSENIVEQVKEWLIHEPG